MARRSHTLRVAGDLLGFVLARKKWWLLPILVVVLLFVGLVVLTSTPIAPFVYTVF